MARIKKHRDTQNRQGTKRYRRKPNIPELVYKYIVANEALDDTKHLVNKCHSCGQEKHRDEIEDSIPQTLDGSMGYTKKQRQHKDSGRISKLRSIKRRPISKDLATSYLKNFVDGEDTKKTRKYMKKALDFGVESGYLIPSDSTCKVLRVSSNLMKNDSRRSKSICDTVLHKNCNTPTKLEDLEVQEQRRRRRRRTRRRQDRRSKSGSRIRRRGSRRRRRSRSRSRGRRRSSSPQNPDEVVENKADNYEMDENDPKSNIHTDDVEGEPKTARSNQANDEQFAKKDEENDSDSCVDEDETDDENENKETEITKS